LHPYPEHPAHPVKKSEKTINKMNRMFMIRNAILIFIPHI
jgi:hypothetical protein